MPTTRELLETTIDLEKRSMALYARFAKIFAGHPRCMISGSGWREMKRATSERSTWSRLCSSSKECSTAESDAGAGIGPSCGCARCIGTT